MALFAISDLHLDKSGNKPMDVFGNNWFEHDRRIRENWLDKVFEDDTVLISGDISWAMDMENVLVDLEWIHELPGKKVFVKGNHDYWWTGIKKLNNLYEDMKFIQNNFYIYNDYAICGTRGWNCPGNENFTSHDQKIYNREVLRLKNSLESASRENYKKFIVMMHYPPIDEKFMNSEFTNLFKEYGVEKVIYGHLHGESFSRVISGEINGIEYILTSADYINFNPIKII
ncbi:metallophosphoesterase [Clostridium sp. LBM24168]